MVVRQGQEILRSERRLEHPRHRGSIQGPHPEGDEGPRVPEDGIPHLRLKLREVLMGQDEVQPVLPQLGEHGGERKGGESVHSSK